MPAGRWHDIQCDRLAETVVSLGEHVTDLEPLAALEFAASAPTMQTSAPLLVRQPLPSSIALDLFPLGALEVIAGSESAALRGTGTIEFEIQPGLGMERPGSTRVRRRMPLDELQSFESLLPGSYRWTARGSKGDYESSGEVVVREGEPSLLVLPLVESPIAIRGTVTISGERAVAGQVQCTGLHESASFLVVSEIDAQGRFSVSVPRPGTYRLFCLVPDRAHSPLDGSPAPEIAFAKTVTVPDGESPFRVDLGVDAARLAVQIVDVNGVPVVGATVTLDRSQRASQLWMPAGAIMRDRAARTVTRSKGIASFAGIEPGPYWIKAHAPDHTLVASPTIFAVSEGDTSTTLTLKAPASIEFRLRVGGATLDAALPSLKRRFLDGRGVVDARSGLSVWLRADTSAQAGSQWTRVNGFRLLESDDPGRVRVRIPSESSGSAFLQVAANGQLLAGVTRWDMTAEVSSPVVVDLQPTGSVRCRCVDDKGTPKMFFLSASTPGVGQLPSLEATNSRAFEHVLTGVPVGAVDLQIRTSDGLDGSASTVVTPDAEQSLRLVVR